MMKLFRKVVTQNCKGKTERYQVLGQTLFKKLKGNNRRFTKFLGIPLYERIRIINEEHVEERQLFFGIPVLKKLCFPNKKKTYIFGARVKRSSKSNEANLKSRHFSNGVGILTTNSTLFIAESISKALMRFNINSEIIGLDKYQSVINDERFFFVLTPMNFKHGLPANHVVIQMEQTISNRWFTPEYISQLKGARAVLDYSLKNLEYLRSNEIATNRAFYVPIAPMPCGGVENLTKKTDVLFYGDNRCERRRNILGLLGNKIDIKQLIYVYGDSIQRELDDAKLVLNVHYYEGAMLETTRICEALSHGCLVISEGSVNDAEYPELADLVDFVPVGDVSAMEDRINYWLSHPQELQARRELIASRIESLFVKFCYSIGRVLYYFGLLSLDSFYHITKGVFAGASTFYLANNETGTSDKQKKMLATAGFKVFPAIKSAKFPRVNAPSYAYLSQLVCDSQHDKLVVCEDRVEIQDGFDEGINEIVPIFNSEQVDVLSVCSFEGESPFAGKLAISSVEREDTVFAFYSKAAIYRMALDGQKKSFDEKWKSSVQDGLIVKHVHSPLSLLRTPVPREQLRPNPHIYNDFKREVSVIIPCYNQEKFISACLDSVLAQSYLDYEIIVVNDGSCDSSADIIQEYVDKYPNRITGINQPNQGVVASRNNAIQIAKGKYIFPLDGDDMIAPSCLEKLHSAIVAGLGDVVYSQTRFFGINDARFQLELPTKNNMIERNRVVCSAMYRKEDWKKYGGYDVAFKEGYEDWDFWLNFIYDNKKFYRIDEDLFFYRLLRVSRNTRAQEHVKKIRNQLRSRKRLWKCTSV